MNNTDFSKKGFTTLARTYLQATNRFAELEKQGSEIELSVLELLDEKIAAVADALHDKVLVAGRPLRTEINGIELAVTLDGQILTR